VGDGFVQNYLYELLILFVFHFGMGHIDLLIQKQKNLGRMCRDYSADRKMASIWE